MIDDERDESLRRAARGYNAPPETPRDAMWARIQAERQARAVQPIAMPVQRPRWRPVAVGIAAALLLGIAIGHSWRSRELGRSSAPRIATTSEPPAGGERVVAPPLGTSDGSNGTATRPASGSTPKNVASALRAGGEREALAGRDRSTRTIYTAAVVDHLGRTEALLTSFRAESRTGSIDSQITAWAGDLLGNTRLLLDAPATQDPHLRKLLGDLEVVLAQIAQLRPQQGVEREDIQIIDQAVKQHDMMTRLRTATPAGMLPAGT